MNSEKEKEIKKHLEEVWEKEMIRVSYIPNGWTEKRATLGKGTVKLLGDPDTQEMLDLIKSFGIDMDVFKAMNPDYKQIKDVHNAITVYRFAVNVLKDLKDHMNLFKSFKEWRN